MANSLVFAFSRPVCVLADVRKSGRRNHVIATTRGRSGSLTKAEWFSLFRVSSDERAKEKTK
jgi:hypothetical protein